MRKVLLSLGMLLFVARVCLGATGDVCPKPGDWLSTIDSGTAIDNAGDESVDGQGFLIGGCRGGGTGWHATKGGVNVMVSNYHVLGGSGHAVSPDISARGCQLERLVYNGKNNCVSPYFVSPCYVLTEGKESTELGPIQGGTKPRPRPAINLDDAAYSKAGGAGYMLSTIANIGPVGIPLPIGSVVTGLGVQFNGATSCHQFGIVQSPSAPVCEINNGPCFANTIKVSMVADHGDSGSLVVTQIGNNPVGLLFQGGAGTTSSSFIFLIPIGQVIKDLGLDSTNTSPGVRVSQADDAVKATISRNRWIAKVKHVYQVSYGLVRGELSIVVYVDDERNVPEVSRKVPSRIEGFPVDVEAIPEVEPL
jgi:hypothetical protein